MTKHSPTQCIKDLGTQRYSAKNWSVEFVCPTCAKRQRANTNFLGSRKMVCTGVRITKVASSSSEPVAA